MIWFGSNLGIKFTNNHNSFINWLIYAITNLKADELIQIAAVIYGIWFSRNKYLFELRDIAISTIIDKAKTNVTEYQLAVRTDTATTTHNSITTDPNNHHQSSSSPKRWSKPCVGTIKVNCDANLTHPGRWGLGASFRDSDGALVAAATWETPGPEDPALAEAGAIYRAILLASECCFREIIIESDNQAVISLINSVKECPRTYMGTLGWGIKCNTNRFKSCSFRHVSRTANRVAHVLASLAHLEPNRVWLEDTPPQLVSALLLDLIH
jgi:ribonuclease HI